MMANEKEYFGDPLQPNFDAETASNLNLTEKDALSFSDVLPRDDSDDTTSTLLPPPYTDDEPPAYSSIVDNSHTVYLGSPPSLDCMDKLPFGEPRSYYPQTPQAEMQAYPRPYASQQMGSQQVSFHYSHNTPLPSEQVSTSTAPHKVLLQPTTSRVVETKAVGRRKTKSHVTDLETGKEYVVEEKTSRNGRRSKAVIKEIGGPKTYVKETPTHTVVCHKKK